MSNLRARQHTRSTVPTFLNKLEEFDELLHIDTAGIGVTNKQDDVMTFSCVHPLTRERKKKKHTRTHTQILKLNLVLEHTLHFGLSAGMRLQFVRRSTNTFG